MVQEVDDDRKHGIVWNVRMAEYGQVGVSAVEARAEVGFRGGRQGVCFVFQDCMEENLEGMRKVHEVLIMRRKDNSFASLSMTQMEAEDVVDEEVCL